MNKNHIVFTILNFFLLAHGMEEQEKPALHLQQEAEKILYIIANDPSATPPTGDDFEIKNLIALFNKTTEKFKTAKRGGREHLPPLFVLF